MSSEPQSIPEDDPNELISRFESKDIGDTSDWSRERRKLRLMAVACCQRAERFLRDERSRAAVRTAERIAEGDCSPEEQDAAWSGAYGAYEALRADLPAGTRSPELLGAGAAMTCLYTSRHEVVEVVYNVACATALERGGGEGDALFRAERQELAKLMRDIAGPDPRIKSDPTWLTSNVIALARSAYRTREFSVLPVLADALQDAGCDNEAVLSHCRGPGPHVHGCWVLDLLLEDQ